MLVTGARSPAALEWARLFNAAGFKVLAADSVPTSLCAASNSVEAYYRLPQPNACRNSYLQALEELIVAESVDWVWPTCEEIFHIAAGLQRLSALAMIFTEPLEKLHELHNKWRFIQKLEQWGWTAPETWLFDDPVSLQTFCSSFSSGELVIKPVYSRFASRVQFYDGSPPAFLPGEVSSHTPWLVQRAIRGKAYCTYSIAVQGRLLAHCAYTAEFTAGQGASIAFTAVDMPELEQWAADFAARERFTGQLAFDFILTADGVLFPLECNPRATSGIHLFQPDDSLPELLRKSLPPYQREDPEPVKTREKTAACPAPGRLVAIRPAMLLYGCAQIRSFNSLSRWLAYMFRGRDAIFRWQDIRPAWRQPGMMRMFWQIARNRRVSILEATTMDIEWNGEP